MRRGATWEWDMDDRNRKVYSNKWTGRSQSMPAWPAPGRGGAFAFHCYGGRVRGEGGRGRVGDQLLPAATECLPSPPTHPRHPAHSFDTATGSHSHSHSPSL